MGVSIRGTPAHFPGVSMTHGPSQRKGQIHFSVLSGTDPPLERVRRPQVPPGFLFKANPLTRGLNMVLCAGNLASSSKSGLPGSLMSAGSQQGMRE